MSSADIGRMLGAVEYISADAQAGLVLLRRMLHKCAARPTAGLHPFSDVE